MCNYCKDFIGEFLVVYWNFIYDLVVNLFIVVQVLNFIIKIL